MLEQTPGPWRLQPIGNGYRVNGGPTLRAVAHVPARRAGDAHLIVAAPELLAACEELIRAADPCCSLSIYALDEALDRARHAVAQAHNQEADNA